MRKTPLFTLKAFTRKPKTDTEAFTCFFYRWVFLSVRRQLFTDTVDFCHVHTGPSHINIFLNCIPHLPTPRHSMTEVAFRSVSKLIARANCRDPHMIPFVTCICQMQAAITMCLHESCTHKHEYGVNQARTNSNSMKNPQDRSLAASALPLLLGHKHHAVITALLEAGDLVPLQRHCH